MATSSTSGVLLSASSISEYKDQIQTYLTNYRKLLETQNLSGLNTKKDTYNTQKSSISTLAEKLTSLQNTLKLLSTTGSSSLFNSFSSSISSTMNFNPILTGTLSAGNHLISVQQLAKNDKVLSNSVVQGGDNILTNLGTGEQTFTMKVGSEEFNVNFQIEAGDDNKSILNKIASAVNTASGGKVNASLVNDTANTTRLVFTSKETGKDNAIEFTQLGALSSLGFSTNRTATSGVLGGYLNANIDELDAVLNVDGVNITRSSNSISGVIDGITLDLKAINQPTDNPTNLVIAQSRDNAKGLLDKFMEEYNTVVKYISEQVKASSTGKSIFSGDTTLRSLTTQMRSVLNQNVGGLGEYSSLHSIGIKINSDGTLAWGDTAKFNKAFEQGSFNISDIFNSTNGLANNLTNYLNNYTKSGGILYNKSLNIQNQIKTIESRISSTNLRIDKMVDRVTISYNNLLSSITNLQNQQSMMQQFQNGNYY